MPMLEALVCEVHSAALLTATIASAINAFRRARFGAQPRRSPAVRPRRARDRLRACATACWRPTSTRTRCVSSSSSSTTSPRRASPSTATSPTPTISAKIAPPPCTCSTVSHHLAPRLPGRAARRAPAARRAFAAAGAVHEQLEAAQQPAAGRHHRRLARASMPRARSPFPICRSDANRRGAPSASRARLTYNRATSQAFVRDVSPGGFGLERVPQLVPKTQVRDRAAERTPFFRRRRLVQRLFGRRALRPPAAAQRPAAFGLTRSLPSAPSPGFAARFRLWHLQRRAPGRPQAKTQARGAEETTVASHRRAAIAASALRRARSPSTRAAVRRAQGRARRRRLPAHHRILRHRSRRRRRSCDALSEAFPGVPVSGCSTAGEIGPSGMMQGGLVADRASRATASACTASSSPTSTASASSTQPTPCAA